MDGPKNPANAAASAARRQDPSAKAHDEARTAVKDLLDCAFAKRKAFWEGLGSREPEGPGLLARLWIKEDLFPPAPGCDAGITKASSQGYPGPWGTV